VYGRDALQSLGSDVTTISRTGASNDDIDLAAFRVESARIESWPPDAFVTWTEIDHVYPWPARHAYLVAGYPNSQNRRALNGDELNSLSYRLVARDALPDEYVSVPADPQRHLLVGFDKARVFTTAGRMTAPDPYGLSGCGAWRLGLEPDAPEGLPRLSAIMIEWRRGGRFPHLLGTRIFLLIQALVAKHKDVAAAVTRLTQREASA
jgi:hypothetical protein